MQAIKTVQQPYVPSPEMLVFLDDFRKMVNEAIRIALAEKVTSQFAITTKVYPQLANYPYPTAYRLSACNVATGILRNYRHELRKHPETKKPYVRNPFVRMWVGEERAAQLIDGKIRLSIKSKEKFVFIPLSDYVLQSIRGYAVKSVTLSVSTLSLSFAKEVTAIITKGLIGIDRNLDNVTTSNLKGEIKVYDLSEATDVKQTYYFVRSHFRREDIRIRKKVYGKYGRKQRAKVGQVLHTASKAIVEEAVETSSAIVMEDLKGIRKIYRKGNGQGNFYRGRMNSWSFFELQRQIEYKANWIGIKVIYVKPNKTSSLCSICGCELVECTQRKVWCSHCMKSFDRDENAALNIVKRGSFLAPNGSVGEAMKGNEYPQSGRPLILQVDTDKNDRI